VSSDHNWSLINESPVKILIDIVRYLARQRLALRGHGAESDENGNFHQLVLLFIYLFIYITSPFNKFTQNDMYTIQYHTIQYKNNTIQYKKQNDAIQSNTRQYSIYIYSSVQYNTYSQMAGTPQQLKPITVGPFNI
jgi:hypothetical protein